MDDAEDGAVGTNPKRQGESRQQGKPRVPPNRPKPVADVLTQAGEEAAARLRFGRRARRPGVVGQRQLGDEGARVDQFVERQTASVRFGLTACHRRPVAIVQVVHQLGDDIGLAGRIDRQAGERGADIGTPIRHVRPWW